MNKKVKWVGILSTAERNHIGLIRVRQNNVNSEVLGFEIIDGNGEPYDLKNRKVLFCTYFDRFAPVEQYAEVIENGKIIYTMNEHDMQKPVRINFAYFKIMDDKDNLVDTTQNFSYDIMPSIESKCGDFGPYIIRLEEVLDAFLQINTDAKKELEQIIIDFNKQVIEQQQNFDIWFESIREILESVDPGGIILNEIVDFRYSKAFDKHFNRIKDRGNLWDRLFKGIHIDATLFDVDMTGKTDSTEQINQLIDYVNSYEGVTPTVFFPEGELVYSETMHFKREVIIKSNGNSWFDYTGETDAMILGPNGLTYDTYLNHRHYKVEGIKFHKSEKAKVGIRVNKFVTQPVLKDVAFRDFGAHNSWGVYVEDEVWFVLLDACLFDNGRNSIARQFIYSTPHGNTQVYLDNCLVHSLSGIGEGVVLNGVGNLVSGGKIEGFATPLRFGSQADYSTVQGTYFEKAGATNTGCIELGEKDKSISTRGPRGVNIIQNYANIHLLANNPVSRFVKVANDEVVIKDLLVERNGINDYNEEGVGGIAIQLNNVPGNDNNYANGNIIVGKSKIANLLTNSNNIMGTDSHRNIMIPKMQADVLRRYILPTAKGRVDIQDSNGKTHFALETFDDRSVAIFVNDILAMRVHNDGKISFGKTGASEKYDFDGTVRAKSLKVAEKKSSGAAGEIYEGSDGNLYYVNLQGQSKKITS